MVCVSIEIPTVSKTRHPGLVASMIVIGCAELVELNTLNVDAPAVGELIQTACKNPRVELVHSICVVSAVDVKELRHTTGVKA